MSKDLGKCERFNLRVDHPKNTINIEIHLKMRTKIIHFWVDGRPPNQYFLVTILLTKMCPDSRPQREVFSKCHQKLIFIERDLIKNHLRAQGQQQLQVAPFRKLLRLTVNYNVKDECRASLWPVLDSSLFF